MGFLDIFKKPDDETENSIITLGYDVKIPPENDPYIIEINGSASGQKGHEILSGDIEHEKRLKACIKAHRKYSHCRTDVNYDRLQKNIVSKVRPGVIDSFDVGERMKNYRNNTGVAGHKADRETVIDALKTWADREVDEADLEVYLEFWGIKDFYRDPDVGFTFICDPQKINSHGSKESFREYLTSLYRSRETVLRKIILVSGEVPVEAIWVSPDMIKASKGDVALYNTYEETDLLKTIKFVTGIISGNYREELPLIFAGEMMLPLPDISKIVRSVRVEHSIYRALAGNPEKLEAMTKDKMTQKRYIPKHFRPPACTNGAWDEFIERMRRRSDLAVNGNKYPYIVIKPKDGIQGDNIEIVSISDPEAVCKKLAWHDFTQTLLEAFIPSKPIINSKTGKAHDGCMRYLLDILVQRNFDRIKYKPIYESAYWRLAPKPMQSRCKNINKYRANLAKNAIPEQCSPDEIKTARKAVMQSVALIMDDVSLFI